MIVARVALVATLLACDKRAAPTTAPAPTTPPAPTTAASPAPTELPAPVSRQLITGVIDDWSSTRARLQLWTRPDATTAWTASGPAWDAVIGQDGAAWGVGLHQVDSPERVKREGDTKAPAGMFELRGAYGYAAHAPAGTKLPYTAAGTLECVDDPASKHYTRIVDGASVSRDWTSSEQMRRADALYTYVIDIAHNPTAAPHAGSCIFFHVWGGADDTTIGCTAMAEDKLVAMLQQLDPAARPVYVLLPRAEYAARADRWKLPPLAP